MKGKDKSHLHRFIPYLVIWVFFGACIVLAKRQLIKCGAAYILMIALAAGAAYLAIHKPAFGQKSDLLKGVEESS